MVKYYDMRIYRLIYDLIRTQGVNLITGNPDN